MKCMVWLLICCSLGLSAKDEIPLSMTVGDYEQIIGDIVGNQPANKEIMYVNMLFQLKAPIRYSDDALKQIERILARTSDHRFAKSYSVNPLYRKWMLEIVSDFRTYNADKEARIQRLAADMDDSGHSIGDALNTMPGNQLLYLIRFLGSSKHRPLLERADGKMISSSQLLVVMQEEQNSRVTGTASTH